MKKRYLAPEAIITELHTEGMMALSGTKAYTSDGDAITDKGNILSTEKGGWNADLWSETEE